jgi:hypothetical protein
MMRRVEFAVAIFGAVWVTQAAGAQSLLRLQSAEDKRDKYNFDLRAVFKRIYGKDVVLSVLCVPSFVPEEAGGILKTSRGYQAFALVPSASTWETEYWQFSKEVDARGRVIPHPREENLKKGLPLSYHGIKVRLAARPLPSELAEGIRQLWQAKLREALHPPPAKLAESSTERVVVTDGVNYYYSMPLDSHGLVTAEGQPATENTPVWLMGELSEKLMGYAKGKESGDDLRKALRRVERKRA